MRIAILGSNSFIAKSIVPLFEEPSFFVTPLTREKLNLLISSDVSDFFNRNEFNAVINCAISGEGRLLKSDTTDNFYENILMHENVLYACEKFNCKLIDFASGAQFDRNKDIIIDGNSNHSLSKPPDNVYSLAKRVNYFRSIASGHSVLRIFNAFGPLEKDNRFIKSTILKCMNNENVEIWGDKYFDFFYVEDLYPIIKFILRTKNPQGEIDCVYRKKYTLSQIADIIKKVVGSSSKITVVGNGVNNHYISKSILPYDIHPATLHGLEHGIKRTYECLKQEKR